MCHRLFSLILLILSPLGFLCSCEDDFEVSAPYKEQYVVYGLLDIGDTTRHTIRVQKLFQNEGVNAGVVAQKPDSVYPPSEVEVFIIEKNPSNFQTLDTLRFDTDTANTKRSGFFLQEDHVLYRSLRDKSLNEDFVYQLLVRNRARSYRLRAETRLVGRPRFTRPRPRVDVVVFDFTDRDEVNRIAREIRFFPGINARSFGISLRFFYDERRDGGPWKRQSLEYSITGAETQFIGGGGTQISRYYDGGSLYRQIGGRLTADPALQRRLVDSAVIVVANAEEELENYIRLSQVSGGPVESAPQYTNIENGLGVFSSRSSASRMVRFNQFSKDSLLDGRFTRDLNFQLP